LNVPFSEKTPLSSVEDTTPLSGSLISMIADRVKTITILAALFVTIKINGCGS
jgi:hypothetical protein